MRNAGRIAGQTDAAIASMKQAFKEALRRMPDEVRTHTLRMAGRPIRLTIAGSGLSGGLTAAMAHLLSEGDPDAAELTVELWDGRATGVELPVKNLCDVFDRTWPFGRSVLARSSDERVIGYQSFGSSMIYDREERSIVGWFASDANLSLFEQGKPMQPLLFAWHADNDTVPVHSGLVSKAGRGVLMGGAGGSGKSTTCLLCLENGFDYLGDDYIGIPPPDGGPFQGFSFYGSTWLDPHHIGRLAWLEPHARHGTPDDDKHLVLLGDLYGDRLADRSEIAAILLPRVTGKRDTTVRKATRTESALRLAPSSILQLPFIRPHRALERITDLAHAVPTYWLELGTELDQIPARVNEILEVTAA